MRMRFSISIAIISYSRLRPLAGSVCARRDARPPAQRVRQRAGPRRIANGALGAAVASASRPPERLARRSARGSNRLRRASLLNNSDEEHAVFGGGRAHYFTSAFASSRSNAYESSSTCFSLSRLTVIRCLIANKICGLEVQLKHNR